MQKEDANEFVFTFLIYSKGCERIVFLFKGQESLGGLFVCLMESTNMNTKLKFVLTQNPALSHPHEQACVSPGLEGRQPQWYHSGDS